jgi:plastocyanin
MRPVAGMMVLIAAVGGCSGSSGPSSPSGGDGGAAVSTTTITITSSGATPRNITVAPGSRVTFVNSDSRPHEMTSNPHPEHTDCPTLNDVGHLTVGQTKTSGNLNTVRTCGFHDHLDPGNTSLSGTIRVQ